MQRTAFRVIFSLAAVYNLAFGVWAGLFPLAFFERFDLETPRYPSLWSCLGMVVGLYGVIYVLVALKPEEGGVLAAVGLLGKFLGPAGWLVTVQRGELPARTFPLILCNDLGWWLPFACYLIWVRRCQGARQREGRTFRSAPCVEHDRCTAC
jgi:hypothetical protein